MRKTTERDLQGLYKAPRDSHKGENGRLLVIGGSKLFHASIFWAADVASRIVDLVHFTSPAMENNELVRKKAKSGFWNGIVVAWERVEQYIKEDDCVLIGPGMPRASGEEEGDAKTSEVINTLLKKFPEKRWVIDGGALQELDVDLIGEKAILTPHGKEFEGLWSKIPSDKLQARDQALNLEDKVGFFAKQYKCTVLFKGVEDVVCSPEECRRVVGGNSGMTKGGTGDVLAGLVAALYCKNDGMLAAMAGSYINKKAGDSLYKRMGLNFNASDLVMEVPNVMK